MAGFMNVEKAAELGRLYHLDKIYQLGDSISDTGNLVLESPHGSGFLFTRPPYGETTFGKPTGRCSNGLLMVDYFATAFGLPYLEPYKKAHANFKHGVNFAVAGATALSEEALKAKNITNPATNSSLSVQLEWMASHFNSTCHAKEGCWKMLRSALFFVGEIGGNDYNYGFVQRKTLDELTGLVPDVVQSITDAVRRVIGFGARRVIVPGNFPIGCLPIYLSSFHTNNSAAYDEKQCLKDLNNFAEIHNEVLKASINVLKKEYPYVDIVYGDYYNAYLWLLSHAKRLRFDRNSLQKACCGSGSGPYNFDPRKMCGAEGVSACPNPDKYISWDGIHSTQRAYKYIAGYLLRSILPQMRMFHL
ncbi:GDSL esterase/lipase At5g03980-like [Coffea eugenioides]|uniref:GDSL esterase/lipase At5g03980-like n=1 Tax=Coffea eugenioides TaxID=49369 RepID=UPI000F60F8C8|nr:GDSL esterase/lipase At5g03980-like [Coffea eugenioides]